MRIRAGGVILRVAAAHDILDKQVGIRLLKLLDQHDVKRDLTRVVAEDEQRAGAREIGAQRGVFRGVQRL